MAANTFPAALKDIAAELPLTLTRDHAMDLLHMSERTFTRTVKRGDLKVIKSGEGRTSRILVPRSEVLRWMAERVSR